MGDLIAYGPCWVCRTSFTFDPDLVPSVPIDPESNLPPDVGGTDPKLATKQPICPFCVDAVNRAREARGQPTIFVPRGAYLDGGG